MVASSYWSAFGTLSALHMCHIEDLDGVWAAISWSTCCVLPVTAGETTTFLTLSVKIEGLIDMVWAATGMFDVTGVAAVKMDEVVAKLLLFAAIDRLRGTRSWSNDVIVVVGAMGLH